MKKRILSIVTCLALCLSLLPAVSLIASATDTTSDAPVSSVYSISADTEILDFGSVQPGYATPEAKTITIQNKGSQQITLEQPTASNYTIGTLSETTLAADGTATFTVQPKSGLGKGTYDEPITVTGVDGENRAVISILTKFTVESTVESDYAAGDVAAIQAIIDASDTLKGKYDVDDPAAWEEGGLVDWTEEPPRRATVLTLQFTNDQGQLTDVTDFNGTLDASALTALETLSCSGNDGLKELILPASLKWLICYDTNITELNISGCTALEYLECYNTNISDLVVSDNTDLTYLDCEETKVSSLELSGLSELATLYCNSTPITSLDVSGNSELKYLNCEGTGIKTLDLSANRSLTTFDLPTTLEQLVTPDGDIITLTQTAGGAIQLFCENDDGNPIYKLKALTDPDYAFARWNGVADFIEGTTEDDVVEVKFNITGNMEISANFMEKRLTLARLAVEGATLTPAFYSHILSYTAEVPYAVTSVNIVAEGQSGYGHQITGAGEHALNVGANTFVVTVIVPETPGVSDINMPEQTLTQEYVITVTRQAAPAGGFSTTTIKTEKNEDGSTTTTTTNRVTGTVTETTKNTDGSTTTVETKKDGSTTETQKTADGTTGTVKTDADGTVTEVTATVPAAAATEAAENGEPVTLPVRVPASTNSEDAPAVEVTLPKNSGAVKVEIPVEKVTPGTVAVIVNADGTEEIVATSIPTDNGVVLTVEGSTTIKVVDNAREFSDVSVNSWFYDAVAFASARGITGGTSATTFSPDATCTRAQMATFLWRAAGSPDPVGSVNPFTDVPADAYYAKAVQWAYEQGITGGTSATTFSPDDTCTRGQMATFLWRRAGSPTMFGNAMPFTDVPEEKYYAIAVQWAYERKITSGTGDGTTFSPDVPCTRAQMVTFLYRFFVK